ncbi:MAG: Hsp20/alpha crystallin family protein [Chroococcus sp. CMT-3BRIN-NPC107]|nr:Hsp20/alpha crystallin family protein [Chroococcus sp. CMT-3BRIN-NPC107]
MTLLRWQPMSEMEVLRRQMDRIFGEMRNVDNEAQATWQPAIELQDTEESVILRSLLPGIEAKDLDIRVTKEAVAISGEHRPQQYLRSEFRYGKFQRIVALPVAVQNDRVSAEFKDGILTLTLPKVVDGRRKVVKVNLTEATASPDTTSQTPTSTV